jgi:hypothetical protein
VRSGGDPEEARPWRDPDHGQEINDARRSFLDLVVGVLFDVPFETVGLLLQPPARVLEGVIDRESQVGMPLIGRRVPIGIDLPAIGQSEMNVHLEETAGAMMPARRLHHDAARSDAAETLFERFDLLLDFGTDIRRGGHTLEFDLNWRLHDGSGRLP